ncbi:MAG: ATP synthase F1 subunit gamma [Deltaproteobacteria bacterium]|nr:ATP synthase F1 subunit gamma [Deltaproteobacteria bacterium]MBW1928778.1 ATP synthase F1 subunit gamma [Deltaproteobacteria bacterium]MBW2024656.1 ATP synthase F1 subunit gamma [Deltaproteobacteria bacterium]MBW2124667.1 ATP synthase F1 subunit gamma [Deltaproteobacteria bacterium]RLB24806.1 MAG: ATP synthase F1 subunit gamma [Deltaproteobacteria bacterium]
MATLRDILRKIGAVKKTRQITKAMNMVAAAKLRNTQSRMESFDPYARKFAEVLGHLASRLEPDIHPLLVKRQEVKNVELLHFSADRGLCGAFNTHLIAEAEKWIKEQEAQGRRCTLTLVGKKGKDYFSKRDFHVRLSHTHIYGKVDISFINQMAKDFIERYLSNEVDEVYMMFSRFVSMVRQEPTLVKLIPIEPPGQEEAAASSGATEYLIEPGAEELLIELLPKHLSVQIYNAFLQNETSEHAARMTAMDNASKNCSEMIDNLTLVYNKARQASITAELMDIVGGAEALRKA